MSSKKVKAKTKQSEWNSTTDRFICFLDIMGFKDWVNRNDHLSIYNKLRNLLFCSIAGDSEKDIMLDEILLVDGVLYISNFSDSIIIITKDNSYESFERLIHRVDYIRHSSTELRIPLKGSIAEGFITCDIRNNIIFGQALIDAYLLQEEIHYYGIVFHHSTEKFFADYLTRLRRGMVHRFATPLKTGNVQHYNLYFPFTTNLSELESYYSSVSGHTRKYVDNTISVYKTLLAIEEIEQQKIFEKNQRESTK